MKRLLVIAALGLLSILPASAQTSVRQSGNVTPTHVTCWTTAGVIQDCGASTSPFATTFGVKNGTGTDGICVQSDASTAAGYTRACLGTTTAAGATLSVSNFGTAPTPGFSFSINGTVVLIPVISGATVAGDGACFNNTSGTLVDCGFAPFSSTLADGKIYVGNASNVATAVTPSGELSMTNAGVFTLSRTYSPTMTGNWTFSPTSGVAITVNGPSNSTARMFDMTQSYGGTGTNTQGNQISISDSANITGAMNGVNISHVYGGGASQGSRNAVQIGITLAAPTNSSNPSGTRFYTALTVNAQANTGDGGGSGTEHGSIIGFNPTCTLGASATFLNECSAMQVQVASLAGSSVLQRAGITISDISGAGGSQGSQFDAGIAMGNTASSPGFKSGVLFDASHFASGPLDSTNGRAIEFVGSQTVKDVLYAPSVTTLNSFITFGSSFIVGPAGQTNWSVTRSFASATNATWDDLLVNAATTTITGNTGSPITKLSKVRIQQPTLTDSSAVTVTDATTLDISNAPSCSGSVTCTNVWALFVTAGNVNFGAALKVATSVTSPLMIGGTGASDTLTLESTSGSGSTDAIIFKTASQTERARIETGGKFNIGPNVTADALLTVNQNTAASTSAISGAAIHVVGCNACNPTAIGIDAYGGQPSFNGRRAQNTQASKQPIVTGNSLFSLTGDGWDGSVYSSGAASIQMSAGEDWGSTAHGTRIVFFTTANTTTTLAEAGRFQASGGLSVGATTDPGTGGLFINGATITLNGLATDATHTDRTVCQDTTSKSLFFGSGAAGICLGTSSEKFKHDIEPLRAGLDQIVRLRAVAYRLNSDHGDPDKLLYGFTAEQGATVLPDLVGRDTHGRPLTFDYMGVVPVLVRAVQQLKHDNDNLRAEVHALKRMNP